MMKVLWLLFELLINVYQGIIMTYFMYSYLGDKKRVKFIKSKGVLFALLFAGAITAMNVITYFEHVYALIYSVILFVYALCCLNGSLTRKIFVSILAVVILLISTAFIGAISSIIFQTDLYLILTVQGLERFVALISTQLLILYFVIIALKALRSDNYSTRELSIFEWLTIAIVLLISIVIGALLCLMTLSQGTDRIYSTLSFMGIILINILVCCLVIDLGKKNEIAHEMETIKLAQEYNQQYIDSATAEYDTIRKLQHDFKNNYYTVHTLIKEGNVQFALEQIEDNIELLESFAVFVKSDNPIVNAVVNAKFSEAKTFGIDCSCICGTDFKYIDNLDLCRLLSNLLENAVTACKHSKHPKPSIMLSLMRDDAYLISLKNTIDSSVLDANPHLLTTKNDSNEHGYGIKIIKEIASKYNGFCDFYEDNGMFCSKIILDSSSKTDCE